MRKLYLTLLFTGVYNLGMAQVKWPAITQETNPGPAGGGREAQSIKKI